MDAKGQRIEFTYDAANQLVQKVLKDAVGTITDTVSFTYESLGNLATATDSDSGLTFTYDALSRLTQAQTAATVAQPASTISYTYDKNGNRLSMTDPQAGVTNYLYDALNRLTSLTSPQGTSTFNYDALSRRTALNLPNGSQASYTYDAASQLTELLSTIGATTISRFAYTYDAVGNRITRTTTNGIANYDYDALNRLTDATQPDPVDPLQQLTETFQYDSVGNRTSSHLATGQVHDDANRLLEDSNFTFSYDANGNVTEKINKMNGDRTVYTYNVENQLIHVEQFTVAGGATPVLVADHRYDALGRRIEKVVNGVATRYVYDNEDILLEFDGLNVVQARYTHGPGIDEPLIMLRGGQSFFYHIDGLGSIWDLTDAAGSVARSYTYESFGQLIAQTGTLTNPYTYTGREFDLESGLYYYRARYYESTRGHFLRPDPIGLAGGDTNLYAYVRNDPINLVDPTGLQAFFPVPINPANPLIAPAFVPQPQPLSRHQVQDLSDDLEQALSLFDPRPLLQFLTDIVRTAAPPLPRTGRDRDRETCILLYARCVDEGWTGDCGQCLHFCRAQQGNWPFNRCRPRTSCDTPSLGA